MPTRDAAASGSASTLNDSFRSPSWASRWTASAALPTLDACSINDRFTDTNVKSAMQRLRVLATGCFLEVQLHGLACQLAVVHGGQKRAQSGCSRLTKVAIRFLP